MIDLVERARAIVPKEPATRGECSCLPDGTRTVGMSCHEIHALGSLVNPFIEGAPIMSGLYGDWNIHEKRYERLWVQVGILEGTHTVDLSEAL